MGKIWSKTCAEDLFFYHYNLATLLKNLAKPVTANVPKDHGVEHDKGHIDWPSKTTFTVTTFSLSFSLS